MAEEEEEDQTLIVAYRTSNHRFVIEIGQWSTIPNFGHKRLG